MSQTLQRILNNLRRPLPDLTAYLQGKVTSALWRRSIHRVGHGFHVCRGALIQGGEHISIGDGFYAGQLLWIEAVRRYGDESYTPVIEIGNGVTCSQSVHIAATVRVSIDDGVMFGSRVHVTDHAHGRYHGDIQDSPDVAPGRRPLAPGRPVHIERNVWLADGVVVLPGVTIGEGCVIGANSVVSRSLPPHVIAVGAPAVPIKKFDSKTGQWLPCFPDT
ncbi:acetyltransferase [Pandoraea sp. PE-S2R-1]|uniref:acyltransferase n=1 Tax=Pandoraea sp. PE-S2R-1 TaxID=1986994 RepID=UPI000B406A55|nr:acetyltransferase [Pandoraea sp. PE-S2R-1]